MNVLQNLWFEKAKESYDRLKSDKRGLMDAVNIVLALVMIVIVGAIGIYIADRTLVATGTITNANLSAMSTNLLAAGQTGSGFIVILVISFIGGIAISYMFNMLGKNQIK
jgi:CHASE2 domain-containing sensor protein